MSFIGPRPNLQSTIDSRTRTSILAQNVMVIYDTSNGSGISPVNTATAYCTARSIPTINLAGIDFSTVSGVANFYQQVSVTTAQAKLLTLAVAALITACPNKILCFVFVGDFPRYINGIHFNYPYATIFHSPVGFFDCFNTLEYFNHYPFETTDEYNIQDVSQSFWDGEKQSPSTSEWVFASASIRKYRPNMWYNPDNLQSSVEMQIGTTEVMCYGRVSACIPLTPFVGSSTALVSDLWTKAIAAEQARYTDFGTTLLQNGIPGGSGIDNNPVSRQALQEQIYEGISTTNTYYYGFDTQYPETGSLLYTNTLTNNDPSGWAQKVPGEVGFTTPTNVFLRSPGTASYYDATTRTVEQHGDYSYKNGAICVFSQSYGATPQSYITSTPGSVGTNGVSQSRSSAAIASGATCAFGVTSEPFVAGDLTTYGLVTNLWYGGNCAEWLMKMFGGYVSDNCINYVQYPRSWIMYGDPLYSPFSWRKGIISMNAWDQSGLAWDRQYNWDSSNTNRNPASDMYNTPSFTEYVLGNTNT